jgi:two-component system, OmpR family, phosphate regulon response regulator PhoB
MLAYVVEDDRDLRDLIVSMLEACGWTVYPAEDGIAALGCIHRAVPDLIILDLLMPNLDGTEVLRLVRSTEAGRRIPVVVVTGAPVEDRVRALASAVLVKPFDLVELTRLTHRVTDSIAAGSTVAHPA